MKVATVLLSSEPLSMILRHRGMISVVSRKLITSCSSVLTRAPITPREVSLKYSKGRVLLTVWRKGYRYNGMWANRNADLDHRIVERELIQMKDKRVLGEQLEDLS